MFSYTCCVFPKQSYASLIIISNNQIQCINIIKQFLVYTLQKETKKSVLNLIPVSNKQIGPPLKKRNPKLCIFLNGIAPNPKGCFISKL